MQGEVKITVIATGFEGDAARRDRRFGTVNSQIGRAGQQDYGNPGGVQPQVMPQTQMQPQQPLYEPQPNYQPRPSAPSFEPTPNEAEELDVPTFIRRKLK
jgi:hypothetical protein